MNCNISRWVINITKELKCNIILALLGWDQSVAGSPLLEFLTQALIVKNRSALKSRTVSFFCLYFCSAISLIAGLFHFADQGRINPYNRPPRPSVSFIQGVFCSLILLKVVNSLKTLYSGLVGLRCLAITARGTLVMVRRG